jgi:hypothetical protein
MKSGAPCEELRRTPASTSRFMVREIVPVSLLIAIGGLLAMVSCGSDGNFPCGSNANCDGRSQVCEHVEGGPAPGVDFYACISIPADCESDVSCACVTNALKSRGAAGCSASGNSVTVQIDVP